MNATLRTTPNYFSIIPVALSGFALLTLFGINPVAGAIAVLVLAIVALSFKRPEAATLAVIFAIYINVPAVAVQFHHVPKTVAASILLLLAFPLFDRLIIRKEEIVFDRIAQLMVLYLVAMLFSTLFARSLKLAGREIALYVSEGLIIYLLFVNLIRDLPTLKRAVVVLLLAGSLMGGLTIFQHVTHTLNKNYGGFAQSGGVMGVGKSWGKTALQLRSSGPIGEQNFYARALAVLLPLAYFMVWYKKRGVLRWGALVAGGLIFGGIVFTYSRGALLGIAVVVLLMTAMRYIKVYQIILAGLAAAVLIVAVKPDFVMRVETFQQMTALLPGKTQMRQIADESMRQRFAQNLAAYSVFRDHPLMGVGPAQFARYYSTPYVNRLGLIFQNKGYYAHNMYLQIAAETGVLGLLAFLSIIWVLMYGLWRNWRRLRWRYPDLAQVVAGFLLSCTAFLVTAFFLQLAYQRYFWLLVALASATMHMVQRVEAQRDAISEEIPPGEAELASV